MDRVWILLAKKRTGEASAAELTELEELMERHELRGQEPQELSGQASEVLDRVWQTPLVANPELGPDAKTWEKIQRGMAQSAGHRVLLLPVWRRMAAASVLVLLGLSAFWIAQRVSSSANGSNQYANGAGSKSNQYATQPGSKSKLQLPDGTQVWLNGNSRLDVSNERFGPTTREVYLSGEAFFDVAKNDKAPFIIHTGSIDITVLGTAFNVKAYPGEKNVETALVRGLIAITTHNDPDRKIILKPNEKITIPNDTAVALTPTIAPAVYAITALNTGKAGIVPETVWMQRKLEFDDEPFAELAPKMEAWFDIKIRFGNETIKNKHFSGVIEKETLEETLKDMRLSTPFSYTLKGNDLLIN